MARTSELLFATLLLGACSGDGGGNPQADAPIAGCATSDECGDVDWCNPLGSNCEPRGTTFRFEPDIYPILRDVCATCHVVGATNSQGTAIPVFAGGPNVAYASLVAGGTNCELGQFRVCVNEPKDSGVVVRLLDPLDPTHQMLVPDGYANPWMQQLLHWIAAGARPSDALADAGIPDAPLVIDAPPVVVDAPPPDAPHVVDARPPPPDSPPLPPDAPRPPPGKPVITSPSPNSSTMRHVIPVTWTAPADNGSPITQYVITAQPSTGAATTVTCTGPSFSPCAVSGPSLSVTVGNLANCVAHTVTVTATNAGGSTTSDPVTNVTPLEPPSDPTLPGSPLMRPNAVGELVFSWNASNPNGCGTVSYTVELDPPAGVSCGNGSGAPCQIAPTTSTSFDMTTMDGACPYPALDCNNPRVWSFRVRAANLGGTSGFSSQVSGTPRLGYRQDTIYTIWDTSFNTVLGLQKCSNCHNSVTTPNLHDEPTHRVAFDSIIATGVTNTGFPGMSLLHICPTDPSNCLQMNLRMFLPQSKEDNVIVRWITDGAIF